METMLKLLVAICYDIATLVANYAMMVLERNLILQIVPVICRYLIEIGRYLPWHYRMWILIL